VKLYDVSPVIFAANPEAIITGVKAEMKPYPNEHACRLQSPDDFEAGSFRRTTRTSDGKKYSVIMGRLDGEETMTEQAYRYDVDTWDEGEAETHCKEHDGRFEAAKSQSKSGRVLSASNVGKVRDALSALQALLDAAEGEEEPAKATPDPSEATAAAELERAVSVLKAENDGFSARDAERRIEDILKQIKQEAIHHGQ